MTGFAPYSTLQTTSEAVAIISVDPVGRMAQGMTRARVNISIRCDVPVGGVYVTPDVGDQWYVDRLDNAYWRLNTRIPFNDNNTLIAPVPGQMIIGGTGPVEMNGSQLNVHGDTNIDGILALGDTLLRSGSGGLETSGPALESTGPVEQSIDGGDTWTPVGTGAGGPVDISDVTGLTDALDTKIDKPVPPITAATHTKITYDSDGLVVDGTDAGIPDISGLQAALDAKANLGAGGSADPLAVKGDILARTDTSSVRKAVGPDLTTLRADSTQIDGLVWAMLTKADVGLSNVDNTTDLNKPISNATQTALANIDASQVKTGIFGLGLIPGLDASKIISGLLNTLRIPALDASKIGTGTFLTSLIPNLDASKIGTGTFLTSLIPGLDASQITSGAFGVGQIPGLPTSKITSGQFAQSMLNITNIAAGIISGVLQTGQIPSLDTSKITSGTFPQTMLNITNIAAGIISGVLGGTQIPALDASKITTGTLLTTLIPSLDASKIGSGQFLTSLIPNLDTSKLTSGVLDLLRIPGLDAAHVPALDASKITTGNFLAALIPNLDASTILVGTTNNVLTNPDFTVNATTGWTPSGTGWSWDSTVGHTNLGSLKAIGDGVVSRDYVSNRVSVSPGDTIPVSVWVQISGFTSGGGQPIQLGGQTYLATTVVDNPVITTIGPTGTASWQQLTGTFTVPAGVDQFALRLSVRDVGTGTVWFDDASLETPGTDTSLDQQLLNFLTSGDPLNSANLVGTLASTLIPLLDAGKIGSGVLNLLRIPGLDSTRIPTLDASKIGTGQFLAGLIPGIDATKIISGVFGLGQIPGLDLTRIPNLPAAQITSGTFGTGLIPTLDATKIGSGILNILRIPALDTTQITTGTFPQTMISNLASNLASIFTTITSPTPAALLQNVSVSAIGQFTPELLLNPNYDSLGSVVGGSTSWTWDPAVSHTAGSTGSAKVIASSNVLQLLSDPPIPVSPNQVLSVSHWLQWSGVTASGVAFKLGVAAYLGTGISNTVDIATVSNPAATGAWQQLSGTYTVPASGVDNIRLQLTVNSGVTGGTIWWDDGSVKKTQLLNETWTSGLPGDLNNLFTGVNARALITDVTSLMSAIGLGDPSLTAIVNRLSNLGSTGGFDASKLGNIVNIPQLLAASVAGIGGGANIGASLQQTWDQVSGLGTNNGSLAGILTRLANVGTGGLFDSSALSNLLNHPVLPQSKIPALDGSIIQFGVVPIGQMPLSQLNRTTLPDLGNTLDQITNAFVGAGNQFLGTNPTQARQSMDSIYGQFLDLTQKMQDIRSSSTATDVSGTSVTVNFSQLPDGSLPTSFTVTYSGAGTSLIGIANGAAGWRTQNNNGNRTALIIYNQAPTNTDFQIVRGTLSGAPPSDNGGSKPRIAAIGRVDNPNNPQNYVWARGYNNGFLTYQGDIGCTVNGVDTVWISNIPLTWSMDINFVIGVGGNPRRYQVFSGSTLVYDYTESGTTSQLGAAYRYWGCKSELKTDSGKAIAPPSIVGTSVSDNQPPSVVGSTFRAYRASTGGVTFSGTNVVPTNPPFFDTLAYKSSDFIWDGANLTLGVEGTYLVNIRYQTPNIPGGAKADVALAFNGGLARRMGGGFADSSIGANSGSGIFGMTLVYGHVNDVLTPAYIVTSNTSATGETTGTATYFEVALVNRSTA